MANRALILGAGAAALLVAAGARPARATNYTIAVDVSKQTAGNPHFWSASFGTGTAALTLRSDLQTHYKIGNRELGMQRVRGHGVLSDAIGIYKGAGSYDWTNFDKYLNAIVSAGARPIMELSFMPTALALKGNDKDAPKDYATYKAFIQAVVQHCVDKYGATDVGQWYWEVWNEPDYAGFWNGTNASEAVSAKMTEYYTLYDNAVDAITAVLPNANVGGPATTGPNQIAAFLQHCKTATKRVTFASSHVYPGGASGSNSASGAGLLNDNNTRASAITGAGYTTAAVKSFNTEWNSSYSGQGGGTGDVLIGMDNHWNAPFILKSIKLLTDKNSGDTPVIDVASYWVLSDVFDESSGPSGSYILGKTPMGTLPFGQVFGVMTFQGMRKAAFNAFKMLNYLGPKRLMSTGGTGNDGVDAMATMSANSDEVQILVYNQYGVFNTTGTDMVTVTLNNLPATLMGKSVFVTQFLVDETHSSPYATWVSQSKPTAPTEAQWQAMKAHQHLELMQPVSKTTLAATYSTTFSLNRQAGTLLIVGLNRPVTGRNAFVEIEGEDYDGQSGATKEDSNDSATVGQSISLTAGGSAFYNVVDFSDAGAAAVQLRVNAASATTLTLRTDTATGTAIGTCAIAATSSAWATQTCNITQTTGVHTLYVSPAGAMRLNYLKFQQAASTTGTGGAGGGAGGSSGRGGAGGSTGTGSGGTSGRGGTTGSGSGGIGSGSGGTTGTSTGVAGTNGGDPGSAGTSGVDPAGSAGTSGVDPAGSAGTSGSVTGAAGTGVGPGAGGSAPMSGGGAGCSCDVSNGGGSFGAPLMIGLFAVALGRRKPKGRRRP